MSQQTLDFRGFLQSVRRYRTVVGLFAAVGLAAGALFTVLHPPMPTSKVTVVLPPSAARSIGTQVFIAGSDQVLRDAIQGVSPPVSLATLRSRIKVTDPTSALLQISAKGTTAAQAEDTANAVADSYVSYIGTPGAAGGRIQARVLERATPASATPLPVRLLVTGVIGALIGALIGCIIAFAISRRERRLRRRDQMADAIGVPVLASIPVGHPSNSAGWTRLLEGYEPKAVHAWSLRKALHRLGLADVRGGGTSIAILSLSSDPGALAIGPQLAAFAASLRVPTALAVGPQQDANATAMLRAACAAMPAIPGRSGYLRLIAGDQHEADRNAAALTVVVAVVDGRSPRVADTMRASMTVLGVSAGAVTAEQLARVAVSAANDGRDVAGIIVADPDSADNTTGRLPQSARSMQRRPTRLTGTTGTRL
jgi:capsular polysaccharide biosynthesis protein